MSFNMKWYELNGCITNGSESFKNFAIGIDKSRYVIARYGEFKDLKDSLLRLREFSGFDDFEIYNLSRGRSIKKTCDIANALFAGDVLNVIRFYKLKPSRIDNKQSEGETVVLEDYEELGFTVKSPFPHYFATSGVSGSTVPHLVAYEMNRVLNNYLDVLVGLRNNSPNIRKILSDILMALYELKFYAPEDEIITLHDRYGTDLFEKDIKSKLKMFTNK